MKNIDFETAALMASVLVGANSHVRRSAAQTATVPVKKPTPEQLARSKREAWNAAVDAEKAAKRSAKGKA